MPISPVLKTWFREMAHQRWMCVVLLPNEISGNLSAQSCKNMLQNMELDESSEHTSAI